MSELFARALDRVAQRHIDQYTALLDKRPEFHASEKLAHHLCRHGIKATAQDAYDGNSYLLFIHIQDAPYHVVTDALAHLELPFRLIDDAGTHKAYEVEWGGCAVAILVPERTREVAK